MKSNNSIIPYTSINFMNSSIGNRFIKIPYSFVKNFYGKKTSNQQNHKVLESPRNIINTDTIIETIPSFNSNNYKKTVIQTETTEQENISQKRHRPKNKSKKTCKLLDEFSNEFDLIRKNNLNYSYRINVDLLKKKQKKFFSFNKNNSSGCNNYRKNLNKNHIKIWFHNSFKDNRFKRYQTLSRSIKKKYLNSKIRITSNKFKNNNKLKINLNNLDGLFTHCNKEINLYTTSENTTKNGAKNFEYDDLAQKHHGNSQIKDNKYNISEILRKIKPHNTQTSLCKKNGLFNNSSNLKTNPRMSNNLTKFIKERKQYLNNFFQIYKNQSKMHSYIQKPKNNKNNINKITLKKINTTNSFATKTSTNIKKYPKTNILCNSNKLDNTKIYGYFTNKSKKNSENRMDVYKQTTKNYINIKQIFLDKPKKNGQNKKLGNMQFINYKQQKNNTVNKTNN